MIIRVEHTKDFTTIRNTTLRDSSLSWKARGLLAYFLTHANEYQIRVDLLPKIAPKDGPTSVATGIKELKAGGYILFKKKMNNKSHQWVEGEWVVREEPDFDFPKSGKSEVRKIVCC